MIKSISLKNYRNISNLEQELKSSGNIIIAPNGSGKTNIIESIFYTVFGSSFRSINNGVDLIQISKESAKIKIQYNEDLIELTIIKLNDKIKKTLTLNSKKISKSKLESKFPLLLFAPSTVDLVIGDPALRREDLNNFLSNSYPQYSEVITRYIYILRNRNALIKQIRERRSNKNLLTYWTNQLITLSSIIFEYRLEFFNKLKEITPIVTKNIYISVLNQEDSNYKELSINYLPYINAIDKETFILELTQKFNQNIDKEILVGKTLYGIHRDDYQILVAGKDLKFIGSRGQQRLGTILIKLTQLEYFHSKFNKYPLLLLDDLMSELDYSNREKITNYLIENSEIQYILTSAEENEIPEKLINISKILKI